MRAHAASKIYADRAGQREAQGPVLSGLSGDAQTLQERLLLGVSRTFALTIPQLPKGLRDVISNLYLLCRIVDTIEDEPRLSVTQKRRFCAQFVEIAAGGGDVRRFAHELAPALSDHTIAAEHDLIRATPAVLAVSMSFKPAQREALARCVHVMTDGMVEFQQNRRPGGLRDLAELDKYCYHVAGIVGETLTELFCEYSAAIAAERARLMKLSVAFGQGLQMTNILKDIWDDRERGACWLPRDIFEALSFDLRDLTPGGYRPEFGRGLERLIGVAQAHLRDAVTYTLLIPKQETGIRSFCLWAIGFAVLTLRKLNRHPDFSDAQQVKISRRSVKSTVLISRLAMTHDRLVRMLFDLSVRGLPRPQPHGI